MWYQKMESTKADKQEIYRNLSAKQPKSPFLSTATTKCQLLRIVLSSKQCHHSQEPMADFHFFTGGVEKF